MKAFRKKIYFAAGYNTIYMGSGRKEFNPKKPMRPFEEYLKETGEGTVSQVDNPDFDEGFIGSFMAGRFINQANLSGFLPYMVPSLNGKLCTGVEGACGTGSRAIAAAVRAVLSDQARSAFVAGFEIQNTMKAVYGADVLAGASYYRKERKNGQSHFFPGIFSDRAGAYYKKYGYEDTRRGMAAWYRQMIENARKNPKAQEYYNRTEDLFALGLTPPNPKIFVPYLNAKTDCSKVTDGASSLLVLSEEGLQYCGVNKEDTVEIIALAGVQGDITQDPDDLTVLSATKLAVEKALNLAGLRREDVGRLEIHDCFSITAILALEAVGFAEEGKGPSFILDGHIAPEGCFPTNLSGGLGGFGHPTGATGVRQAVDLLQQLTGKAPNTPPLSSPYGMMINMGGNDKTVTCIIVKKID